MTDFCLLVRLRNNRADAFAAKRHDDSCLGEHVVGRVAAIVQRGLRIVIVFGHEHFGNARKADVEGAAFARESNHIKLGAGWHLAASVVECVDFGVHHERVLVGFEFVMADEVAGVCVQKVVGEELFFACVWNGLVVESGGCTVVTCADDASVCADEDCAHLRILILGKTCLSAHHLRVDFIAKLCSRTIHAKNISKFKRGSFSKFGFDEKFW